MKKIIPIFIIGLLVGVFFYQTIFKGLIPVPADNIIGLYSPYRDFYSASYPRGIPFKNSLITDPVRQQYPWKKLVIESEKKLNLPLWNPYNFSGTPLLANFQSAAFYPFNLFFFFLPFNLSWNVFIFLGPLFAGVFFYLFITNLKASKEAGIFGAIVFSFCGFTISWLEWGTIIHTALWFPLILLSIDKLTCENKRKTKLWSLVFLLSIIFSFFAGHLQTFFYISLVTFFYFLLRWIGEGKKKSSLFIFLSVALLFLVISSIQWIPTWEFLKVSARSIDLNWQKEGWFIPWSHLVQFFAPDFFGNPSTLNYFGTWNYGEMIGYVGIAPLVFSIYALFFKRDKNIFFFGSVFFIALIFALPTFLSKIPFILNIPFLNTAQPTRLIFLINFSLSVLAAFGFDYFYKNKKQIIFPVLFLLFVFTSLWMFVFFNNSVFHVFSSDQVLVSRNNLVFPTVILIAVIVLQILNAVSDKFKKIIFVFFILITVFDLFRFGWKYNAFTNPEYLFPSTNSITYIQKNLGNFRIMTTDSRIFPPNFSAVYKISSVDGYDPLYLLSYGKFIASLERNTSNINSPFGFNRIITPHNYSSPLINLLGVKYILSLSDLDSANLKKVFQEGELRIYENKDTYPRAFFVENVIGSKSEQDVADKIFANAQSLNKLAIVEGVLSKEYKMGEVEIVRYEENEIEINTKNDSDGFLVLTDNYYPSWKVSIDGKESKIYKTDLTFRGILIPKGNHKVVFYDNIF